MDKCSFCGKSEKFGVRFVRGPEVAICEECVKLAVEAVEATPKPTHPAVPPGAQTVHISVFTDSATGGVGRPRNAE